MTLTPNADVRSLEIDVSDYSAVTFDDVRVSTALFEFFADEANQGSTFRFVAKGEDGTISIERL